MKKDTYSHIGWLQSDRIIKRALACILHSIIGLMMIYGIWVIFFLIFLIIEAILRSIGIIT